MAIPAAGCCCMEAPDWKRRDDITHETGTLVAFRSETTHEVTPITGESGLRSSLGCGEIISRNEIRRMLRARGSWALASRSPAMKDNRAWPLADAAKEITEPKITCPRRTAKRSERNSDRHHQLIFIDATADVIAEAYSVSVNLSFCVTSMPRSTHSPVGAISNSKYLFGVACQVR